MGVVDEELVVSTRPPHPEPKKRTAAIGGTRSVKEVHLPGVFCLSAFGGGDIASRPPGKLLGSSDLTMP